MSTRNADSVIVPRGNYAQQVGTFKDRHTACLCSHKLGVVSHDSGCVDDEVSALDILRSLTDIHRDTHISYSVEGFSLVVIRACQVVALTVEYLSERVHTRAADTDEVDVLFSV